MPGPLVQSKVTEAKRYAALFSGRVPFVRLVQVTLVGVTGLLGKSSKGFDGVLRSNSRERGRFYTKRHGSSLCRGQTIVEIESVNSCWTRFHPMMGEAGFL